MNLCSSLLFLCLMGSQETAPPARVLLVTGQDIAAHDWKTTAPELRRLLERLGQCEVRIVEDPLILSTDLIDAYDAIVLHFYNEAPLKRQAAIQANLERFVREKGGGLVLVHFASGSFGDWDQFVDLAGLVWDKVNTHDKRGPFQVRVLDTTHPITAGLTAFSTDDELYIGLTGRTDLDVLAVARSTVTGRDHPMAVAFDCGRGRVFQTPLGHDTRALQPAEVGQLIERGCLWTMRRLP